MKTIGVTRYRLYIDESGDHSKYDLDDQDKRFLGLTGVILPYSISHTDFHEDLQKIKDKYFKSHPDNPVIFHREDIIQKRGPFYVLLDHDVEINFNSDLLEFITNQKYLVITVVINKKDHIERYGDKAYHPYHYCMTVMLERFCGWLNVNNYHGDIMAESRGGTEDRLLQEAYKYVFEHGTSFRNAEFFKEVLTSRKIKIKKKEANIAGLQLADILAHPCKQDILIGRGLVVDKRSIFVKQICSVMNTSKYNRRALNQQIRGYGKCFLG